VLKKRNIGRRGQATVEYLMFIVVIASIVVGLSSYSSSIESKFEAAKLGLTKKLAGDYELKRSDFFSKKISSSDATGAQGNGANGGAAAGDNGAGGKKPVVQGGEGDAKLAETGKNGTAGPEQTEKVQKSKQEEIEQEKSAVDESNRAAKEYNREQQTKEDAAKEEEKQAISERQLAMASAEDRAALLRKAHDQGLYTDKEKALERREWSIGKLLIIIIVVVIFLIIVLKSRQNRD